MTEIWTFKVVEFEAPEVPDVTGFDVVATDGEIGKVDEATYETGSSCLVVVTGFWIFGKTRMIAAGRVERIDLEDRNDFVGLTKDQIKDAPDYEAVSRDEDDVRRQHTDYYDRV